MRFVQTPSVNDVLCGRVSGSLTHFGNETFRRIVLENKPLYSSSKKLEKIEISRSIVRTIQQMNPSGSFLEYDDTKNLWVQIDEKRAVSKTSQALRESRTLNRNKLKEQHRNISKKKSRNDSKEKSLFKSIAESTSGFIIRNLNLLSSFSSDTPSLCDDSTLRDSLRSISSSYNDPSLCDESTLRQYMQSFTTVEPSPTPNPRSSYKLTSPLEDDFYSACKKITGNGETFKDELLSFGENSSVNVMDFQDQKMNNPKDEEINRLIYETLVLKDIDKQDDALDNNSINSIEVFDQKLKCPVHHYDATKHNQDFAIENMTLTLPCLQNVQKKSSMGKAA